MKLTLKPSQFSARFSLVGATQYESKMSLRIYEDGGEGDLYLVQEPCGHFGRILGVVRAADLETALQTAIDEVLDDATSEQIEEDEEVYFRNAVPDHEELKTATAYADPGWRLDILTDEMADGLKIELEGEADLDTVDTDQIEQSLARSLWVDAYMDEAEEEGSTLDRASQGENWDNVAPVTPIEAEEKASEILAAISHDGAEDCQEAEERIARLFVEWHAATGFNEDRFGHCIGMQWLGTGVGLEDDVKSGIDYKKPNVGSGEFHYSQVTVEG